jgi:HK97 family phage prohead protease
MKMDIERRNVTHEFRVSGDTPTPKISGYASIFNSPYNAGFWTEEVDANAFDSVIASKPDTVALFNHNPDYVLGRTTSGTLSLSIDARGLAYTIDPPDTQLARDLITSMRRGDVTQSSFAFVVARDQWTDNPDGSIIRTILEFAELYDVSPVTYPANPSTSSQVRSLPGSMPGEMRSRLEARALTEACTCICPQCMAQKCGICSADPQCEGAERNSNQWVADTMLRLRLAEAE